ncbi:GAF and ANTAR domain-containing protein [Streptomyces sp. NPDC088785]|uniref:GAF and ANTAR domain-containing protein n=1 Tax=Streptomyces sp. NPDC088785 TaxID=3365897 RepID=UPI00381CDDA3
MDWQDFAVRLAATARELLAADSVDATLDRVTHSALDLIEGCTAAGVLLLSRGTAQTLAPTDRLVNDSDALQAELGEGPCFDAARTGHPVFRIEDLTEEHVRWPAYAPRAKALGIGSMMGFLLYTEDEDLGALNVYSAKPGAFTEDSQTAGWTLAAHAAVAFASARQHAQLEKAVASRHTIGEAMGILMAGHQLSEREAFDVLRRYSQEKNVKLREVAALVCERGDLHEA